MLGDNVRRRRKEIKLTRQQLADAMGIPWPRVWEIEEGKNPNPSAGTLVHLAQALRTSIDELLQEEREAAAGKPAAPSASSSI